MKNLDHTASTPLRRISLAALKAKNDAQTQSLLEACGTDGCFYLELETNDNTLSQDVVSRLISSTSDFFDLDITTKMQWNMDAWGDLMIGGYKPAGKHTGVVAGKRDRFENFLVPLDALHGTHARDIHDWPGPMISPLPTFLDFELACQGVALTILKVISKTLCLPQSTDDSLEQCHRKGEPSTTSLACLKYLPSPALEENQIGHMAHTDVGSLTLLFSSLPGLQVYQERTQSWIQATPLPGYVVVNVGDTLSFMTKGRLKSCLHRVVPHIGADGFSETRHALAFFLRPELCAEFVDRQGRKWSGEDWHRSKYSILRADNNVQKENTLLTGKQGFLGELA